MFNQGLEEGLSKLFVDFRIHIYGANVVCVKSVVVPLVEMQLCVIDPCDVSDSLEVEQGTDHPLLQVWVRWLLHLRDQFSPEYSLSRFKELSNVLIYVHIIVIIVLVLIIPVLFKDPLIDFRLNIFPKQILIPVTELNQVLNNELMMLMTISVSPWFLRALNHLL